MSNRRKNEDTDALKVLLIIAILAIIASLVFGGIKYSDDKKQETKTNTTNTTTTQNNNVVNTKTDGDKDKKNNTVDTEKDKEDDTKKDYEEDKKNEVEEKKEEVSISDDEKAKQLAKEKYGSSEGVYFYIDQSLGNGVYTVSVRDSQTTSAIEWYKVNVNTGTVE